MRGRWIVLALAALVAVGVLAVTFWPSEDDNSAPAHRARTAAGPTSVLEAEGLIRAAVPRTSNVRCRPMGDDWRCTWGTPTQSCNATVQRGRKEFYAGCSRLADEAHVEVDP
jgi:hypothetical protein